MDTPLPCAPPRSTRGFCALLVAATGLFLAAGPARAQPRVPQPVVAAVQPATVPFGPGERFDYRAKWGIFNIGTGSLAVRGVDDIRGASSYELELLMSGGRLGIRIDYDFSSWLDVVTLESRRFYQDSNERGRRRSRRYEIYPETRWWELRNVNDSTTLEEAVVADSGATLDPSPLDEIGFLYWARTLPLEVGETYTFNNYFKDRGNPVILRVLRIETIEVPAGEFETIVVQPIIQTRGLFSEGGEAEVYFTNDEDRLLVRLESRLSIGNLSLHLESMQRGRRLSGMN